MQNRHKAKALSTALFETSIEDLKVSQQIDLFLSQVGQKNPPLKLLIHIRKQLNEIFIPELNKMKLGKEVQEIKGLKAGEMRNALLQLQALFKDPIKDHSSEINTMLATLEAPLSTVKLRELMKRANEILKAFKSQDPTLKLIQITNPTKQEISKLVYNLQTIVKMNAIADKVKNGEVSAGTSKLDLMRANGIDSAREAEFHKFFDRDKKIKAIIDSASQEILDIRRLTSENESQVVIELDLKQIGVTDPILNTILRAQFLAFLQIREHILNAYSYINGLLRESSKHAEAYVKEHESYPVMKNLLEFASYAPISKVHRASLFLGEFKEECEQFRSKEVTLHEIQEVVRRNLPELKETQYQELLFNILRCRTFLLSAIESYLRNLKLLDEYCIKNKINIEQIINFKKQMVQSFVNGVLKIKIDHKDNPVVMIDIAAYHANLNIMLSSVTSQKHNELQLTPSELIASEFKMQDIYSALGVEKELKSFTKAIADGDMVPALTPTPPEAKTKTVVEKTVALVAPKKRKKPKPAKVTLKLASEVVPKTQPQVTPEITGGSDKADIVSETKEQKKITTREQGFYSKSAKSKEAEEKVDLMKSLKDAAEFTFDDSKMKDTNIQIVKSMHVRAVTCANILLTENRRKQKSIGEKAQNEARFLRYAFAHSLGLINVAHLTPNCSDRLDDLYPRIINFAREFVHRLETNDSSKLESDRFYQEAIKHGQKLDEQLIAQQKQTVTSADKANYLDHLSAHLMAYDYDIPDEELPINEHIYNLAMKMLASDFFTYTKIDAREELSGIIKNERHGKGSSTPHMHQIALGLRRASFSAAAQEG